MARLLHFDLETTGVDPDNDRIVEICLIEKIDGKPGRKFHSLVNPGCPIPAEATEVHGISDEDVKDAPLFMDIAADVQSMVQGVILVGYNCRRFDTPLIHEELRRARMDGLAMDVNGRIIQREIDLFQIWREKEKRDLTTAAKRFAGVDLEDSAHSADADTDVLEDIFKGMIRDFGLEGATIRELAELSAPPEHVDRDGKFRRTEEGVVVFNFGNHRDEPATSQPDYLEWMIRKDFSNETKAVAKELLQQARCVAEPQPAQGQAELPGLTR